MNLINKQYRTSDNNVINYYETENSNPVLLIIHAQGTNAISYAKVVKPKFSLPMQQFFKC